MKGDCFNILLTTSLIIGLLCDPISAYSQNQKKADSLVQVWSNQSLSPEQEIEVLRIITSNHTIPDSNIYYSDLLIQISNENDRPKDAAYGYMEKGHGFNQKGDYDEAIANYIQCAELSIQIANLKSESSAYIAMGDSYSMSGDHNNSIAFYNKGIKIAREGNDSIRLATALLNAGDEFFNYESYDSALAYFEESGIIFEAKDYLIGKAYNLGNAGMVHASLGNHALAERNMTEATRVLTELEDYYPIAVYDTYMADIYLAKGDMDRAIEYAMRSFDVSVANGLKDQIKEGALKLSQLYEQDGNTKEAFDFLRIHTNYRDSLNREETIRDIADLRTEFEVSQKQIEVDLLNQQKRNQQTIAIALAVILVLSTVLLVTVYRNSQRKMRLNKELAALNETKDKFFGIISHDLRGPVSAFNGISRIIRMHLKRKDYDELETMTDHIDHSAKSLSELLDNLLGWAVQQQGQVPYNPEKVSLNELTGTIKEVFESVAASKGIEIQFDVSDELMLWADRNSTMTILRNLTGNALKFTPEGGKISISGKQVSDYIDIEIKDTGVGIPDDKLDTLFQPSAKKSTHGTSGEKGLGLGLQLVWEFVQMNNGEISVESSKDGGATFTVRLPKAS